MTISAAPRPLTSTLTRPASRPLAPWTVIAFLATLMVMDCMAASARSAVAVMGTSSGAATRVDAHATAIPARADLSNRMSDSSDVGVMKPPQCSRSAGAIGNEAAISPVLGMTGRRKRGSLTG